MGLFGFGKKKEEKSVTCDCGCSGEKPAAKEPCCGEKTEGDCGIKVLGAGCKSCHEQYENVVSAVKNLGLSAKVEYITDMAVIAAYGVMSMPAIVVSGQVVSMGKVLKTADVEKLLKRLGC
ncbi:MAG: thioredoxin family protein [Clostridia bacterium]